ncbi:hypothetical protein GOBAR_AA28398 [Gossypium barbadense]|uniref:Uncharacterized protein n=1 Tax=Gossypium barbadense TaxID=3634 RepID=A0A2P5WMG7_GOSBA|nr:hypothetical protein GOBAR_AA28398 [Gossypium barbadense]
MEYCDTIYFLIRGGYGREPRSDEKDPQGSSGGGVELPMESDSLRKDEANIRAPRESANLSSIEKSDAVRASELRRYRMKKLRRLQQEVWKGSNEKSNAHTGGVETVRGFKRKAPLAMPEEILMIRR